MRRPVAGDDLEPLPVAAAPNLTPEPVTLATPRRARRWPALALVVAVIALGVAALAVARSDDPGAAVERLDAAWQRARAVTRAAEDAEAEVRLLLAPDVDERVAPALAAVHAEARDRLEAVARDVDRVPAPDPQLRRLRAEISEAVAVYVRRAVVAVAHHGGGRSTQSFVAAIERELRVATRRVDTALDDARRRWDVAKAGEPALGSPAAARRLGDAGQLTDARVDARLLIVTGGGITLLDPDAAKDERLQWVGLRRRDAVQLVTSGDVAVVSGWGARSPEVVAAGGELLTPTRRLGRGEAFDSGRPGVVWLIDGARAQKVDARGRAAGPEARVPDGWRAIAASGDRLVLLSAVEVAARDAVSFRVWDPGGSIDRTFEDAVVMATNDRWIAWSRCPRDGQGFCTLNLTDPATGADHEIAPPGPGRWLYTSGAFSPDGTTLALGALSSRATRGLLLVDVATRATRLVPTSAFHAPAEVTWSPDGRVFFASLAGDVVSWLDPRDAVRHTIKMRVAYRAFVKVTDLAVVSSRPRRPAAATG